MKIKCINVYTCLQPLKIPFQHASSGLVTYLEGVYVQLKTDEGFSGIGEVRGNCSYFTGGTTQGVVSAVAQEIAPRLLGADSMNLNYIHTVIENSIVGNMAAKAACDSAAFDLAGKIENKPVHQLLGGKLREILPSEENLPFASVEAIKRRAQEVIDEGCRFIKLRVGAKCFQEDEDRAAAVWEVIKNNKLEHEIVFSADANQAWNIRDAIKNVNRLVEYGISIIEQPSFECAPLRLKELKKNCPMKLFGDESVGTIQELTKYIELGLIDGVHIKLIKCGGIYNAVKMMHLAENHGIEYMVGGMDEGMLAVAAAVHCAAVSQTHFFEVHGHARIQQDPAKGLVADGSFVEVPDGAGLGIEIEMEKLTLAAKVDKVI